MYTILGCGAVGTSVAKLLASDDKVIVLDSDPKRVESLKEQGLETYKEDITNFDIEKYPITNGDTILVLTPDVTTNLEALKHIRRTLPGVYVVVRALDLASANKMKEEKADYVIQSEVIADSVIKEIENFEERKAVATLIKIIKEARGTGLGIFVHDNPDPDALASAMALKKITDECAIDSKIFYGGNINRQENRAFVNIFEVELTRIREVDYLLPIINNLDKIALIDAPKASANNILPRDVIPNIIIDHHPIEEKISADFSEVRKIGATSTILTKYLQQLEIPIDKMLATALLYGVRSDTVGFTRNTTPEDLNAVAYLTPLADPELMVKVERPPMDPETMDVMGRAILNKETQGPYLISCVNTIKDRDALPQAAEFLLSLEGVSTVLVFGIAADKIVVSGRTNDVRINLGDLLSRAFGAESVQATTSKNGLEYSSAGGHENSAGAQIPLGLLGDVDDKVALVNLARKAVKKQFFAAVGVEEETVRPDTEKLL